MSKCSPALFLCRTLPLRFEGETGSDRAVYTPVEAEHVGIQSHSVPVQNLAFTARRKIRDLTKRCTHQERLVNNRIEDGIATIEIGDEKGA